MENFEEQELELLKQLEIVRAKKQQQSQLQKQNELTQKLNETQLLLDELDNNIKAKKEIYYKLQNEIPILENDRVDLLEVIRDIKKELKPMEQKPQSILKLEPVIIPEPEPIIEEQQPIIIGNMDTFESSKLLSHTELDTYKFWNKSQMVDANTLQVGDYIYINHHKYAGDRGYYGMITRMTEKTIFYKMLNNNDNNKILHYDWKNNGYLCYSYDYYFYDITKKDNLGNKEGKIALKGNFRKANSNFVDVYEMDWGR